MRVSPIDLRFGDSEYELRISSSVDLSASRAVETHEQVSCFIPGHHVAGTEYYADRLAVADDPFAWELEGNCAFVSTFAYSSDA